VIGGPSISTAAASSSAPANSIPSANSANTAPASIPQAPSAPQFTLPPGTLPVASLNPAGGYTVTLTVCGTDAQNNPVAGEPLSLSFSAASGDPVGDTTVMTDATACFTGSVDIGGAGSALPGAGERYNLQRRIRAIHSSAGGGHTAALRSTSPRTACLERRWFIGWDGSSGHGCEQCSTGSHV
jgi:hypothetical protein